MPTTSPKQISSIPSIWATIQSNRYLSVAFLGFIILGGVALYFLQQGDLLLYFSKNRTLFWNTFFRYGTQLGEEWTYISLLVVFLFIRFRYALLVPITGVVVTIISFLSKRFFLHPRPFSYYKTLGTLEDINVVEGVYLVKGLSSFPSGHTMSAFAIFTLIALLLKNKKSMAILLFTLAIIVGLSRIYLVQHFLKDVYLGGIMGVLIALLIFKIQQLFPINEDRMIDSKFTFSK
ncbi:MAG: phosphatase PAP2 family protein [Saprospiraceae bacterium]